jgi:hypothetical protein
MKSNQSPREMCKSSGGRERRAEGGGRRERTEGEGGGQRAEGGAMGRGKRKEKMVEGKWRKEGGGLTCAQQHLIRDPSDHVDHIFMPARVSHILVPPQVLLPPLHFSNRHLSPPPNPPFYLLVLPSQENSPFVLLEGLLIDLQEFALRIRRSRRGDFRKGRHVGLGIHVGFRVMRVGMRFRTGFGLRKKKGIPVVGSRGMRSPRGSGTSRREREGGQSC